MHSDCYVSYSAVVVSGAVRGHGDSLAPHRVLGNGICACVVSGEIWLTHTIPNRVYGNYIGVCVVFGW